MTDHAKAQRLAEQVGALIHQRDASSHFLGITLDAIGPGRAVLSMSVTDSMLNGVGLCHGGFTYKLADDAFAYASNSHNRVAVGQHCTISYPAPARLGDRLTATGQEVFRQGRSGIYDVVVTNATGTTVALFRGHARFLDGHHLAEESA